MIIVQASNNNLIYNFIQFVYGFFSYLLKIFKMVLMWIRSFFKTEKQIILEHEYVSEKPTHVYEQSHLKTNNNEKLIEKEMDHIENTAMHEGNVLIDKISESSSHISHEIQRTQEDLNDQAIKIKHDIHHDIKALRNMENGIKDKGLKIIEHVSHVTKDVSHDIKVKVDNVSDKIINNAKSTGRQMDKKINNAMENADRINNNVKDKIRKNSSRARKKIDSFADNTNKIITQKEKSISKLISQFDEVSRDIKNKLRNTIHYNNEDEVSDSILNIEKLVSSIKHTVNPSLKPKSEFLINFGYCLSSTPFAKDIIDSVLANIAINVKTKKYATNLTCCFSLKDGNVPGFLYKKPILVFSITNDKFVIRLSHNRIENANDILFRWTKYVSCNISINTSYKVNIQIFDILCLSFFLSFQHDIEIKLDKIINGLSRFFLKKKLDLYVKMIDFSVCADFNGNIIIEIHFLPNMYGVSLVVIRFNLKTFIDNTFGNAVSESIKGTKISINEDTLNFSKIMDLSL